MENALEWIGHLHMWGCENLELSFISEFIFPQDFTKNRHPHRSFTGTVVNFICIEAYLILISLYGKYPYPQIRKLRVDMKAITYLVPTVF